MIDIAFHLEEKKLQSALLMPLGGRVQAHSGNNSVLFLWQNTIYGLSTWD